MAAASSRNEALPTTTAAEAFISGAKAETNQSVGAADGTGFSISSQRCTCCPYGYHIDLDFLQFLDSLYNAENLKTLKRFKRGTNSLLSPLPSDTSDIFSLTRECNKETENIVLISDGDGVLPREILGEIDTSLCRTTVTSPNHRVCHVERRIDESDLDRRHAPNVSTETTDSSLYRSELDGFAAGSSVAGKASVGDSARLSSKMETRLSSVPLESIVHLSASGSNLSFEGIFDAESGRVSPTVLQAIREQLLVSLRRMKELEEQLKVIPILQSHISMLKEENSLLTLTTDRTFCDAAVGDISVTDDIDSSSAKVVPSSLSGVRDPVSVETSESVCQSVDSSDSATTNLTEDFSSKSSSTSHLISVLPLNYNLKTETAEKGVNTDDVSKVETESKGSASETATRDSCVGTDIEFVDCGTGDEGVPCNDQDSYILTKHHRTMLSRETVIESNSSRLVSSFVSETGDKALNDSDTFSTSQDFNESESNSSIVNKFGRNVAVQCGDGNITIGNDEIEKRNNTCSDVACQNDQYLTNDKSTQTEDFLASEYVSEILKNGDYKNLTNRANEIQVNTRSADVSKKRITFGEVTIYEAVPPHNEVYILNDNTTTESKTDSVSDHHNESECSKDLPFSSYSLTRDRKVQSESFNQSPVECIVIEQVLESARCGESVIIYDSNESSTTSSDSEDSSALSVLEVTPGVTNLPIHRAVKSVDEYLDEGIAVEEDSVAFDVACESSSVKVEKEDEEKVLVINSRTKTPTVLQTEEQNETVQVSRLFHKDILSEDSEKRIEVIEKSQLSSFIQTNSTVSESPLSQETATENLTASSLIMARDEIIETESKKSIVESNGFSKDVVDLSKDDVDSIIADDLFEFASPATDHVEVVQFQKRHPKGTQDVAIDSQESNIPSKAEAESIIEKSEVVNNYDRVSNCRSESLNGRDDVTQSTAIKKKIVITETRIERRRIDRSYVKDNIVLVETQSSEDRSSASDVDSEVLASNDCDKSENQDREHRKNEEQTADLGGDDVTDQAVQGSSSRHRVQIVDIDDSIINDRSGEALEQLSGKHERYEESSKETVARSSDQNEANEDEDEGHGVTVQDSDKRFEGNICDAMTTCNQWLESPEGADIEKISVLEFIRKQWFIICGRKTSSSMEVKTFLSLALSYSEVLLQTVVNLSDADGNTALHYAVSYANTDVIKHLLDTGCCDVNHQNKAGYTAIMLAALLLVDMDRHKSVIRRLFETGDVNVSSGMSGQTALMLAASHGRNDTVQLLMACGANVNTQDEDGSTALMCASEHGHIDIIKMLLSHSDCDSTLADVDNSTALSIAMEEGYQEIGVVLYAHMKTLQDSPPVDDDEDNETERESSSLSSKQ